MLSLDEIPKYSRYEHERKWLLSGEVLSDLENTGHSKIIDRYLSGSRLRLRKAIDSESGKVAYKLTKKYGIGDEFSEPITTIYLSEGEYDIFAALSHCSIEKRRYKLEVSGLTYSVDVFEKTHQGLILAEIECDSREALLKVPSPPYGLKEVTADEQYSGGFLCRS